MGGYVAVFLGTGIGGMLRYGVSTLCVRLFGGGFPVGTLVVNVVGSLCAGLVSGWFSTCSEISQPLRLFLAVGILGGFTTFSTFSLEIVTLAKRGQGWVALGYAVGSVALATAGVMIAHRLTSGR